MTNLSFELDWGSLFLSLIFGSAFLSLYLWSKNFPYPRIFYSNVKDLVIQSTTLKASISYLPRCFELAALLFFVLAFINPRFYLPKPMEGEMPPIEANEGIAMYFVLDQSGSMAQPADSMVFGERNRLPKVEILKKLTSSFIQGDPSLGLSGRPNDLIGIVAFARVPQVLVPLTLDHQAIKRQLAAFETVKDKSLDGTGIGYAIYKTAHLIAATRHFAKEIVEKPTYEIKNTIMILVTDGVPEANPLDINNPLRTIDIPEAAQYAKEQDIRLYIINIEPKLAQEEFAPFRNQMRKAAELTGGEFFFVNSSKSLLSIYTEIDQLEKSKIPAQLSISKELLPQLYAKMPLYPYLIVFGMCCLLASIVLNTTLLRKVP